MNTRKNALDLLEKKGLSKDKIDHSIAVADLALNLAVRIDRTGGKVNKTIVEMGALLHDIGLTAFGKRDFEEEMANPTPEHCALGAKMVLEEGISPEIAHCVECHELWRGDEAKVVGFPESIKEDYIPKTLEAKIVAYSDIVVFAVIEEGHDLWEEEDAIIETYFPYIDKCYKSNTGKGISRENPLLIRINNFHQEMFNYLEKEDIPEAWREFNN